MGGAAETGQHVPEATAFSVLSADNEADAATFIGRMAELELIRQLLVGGTTRLLTLTGPAGVGKTRLALEAGVRFGGVFPNGVWLSISRQFATRPRWLPPLWRAWDCQTLGPLPSTNGCPPAYKGGRPC
jgi:hypothetical protein